MINPIAIYSAYSATKSAYGTAKNVGAFGLDSLAAYRTGTRASFAQASHSLVEVIGLDKIVGGLVKHGVRLAFNARGVDSDTMERMLQLMRSRVPRDTGRLFNGITGEIDDDGIATVTASAVRTSGSGRESADYARFVEYGTQAGERGRAVADGGFYTVGDNPLRPRRMVRTRKSARSHPGTPAQPFFYNSADEILAQRADRLEEAADRSAAEAGLL